MDLKPHHPAQLTPNMKTKGPSIEHGRCSPASWPQRGLPVQQDRVRIITMAAITGHRRRRRDSGLKKSAGSRPDLMSSAGKGPKPVDDARDPAGVELLPIP